MKREPLTPRRQNNFFDDTFDNQPIMGVFRGLAPRTAVERATLAWDAGVENIEIPVETASMIPTLEAVIAAGAERGKLVGAGTILSAEQVSIVAQAGAAYTVSPGLSRVVAEASLAAGLPHLPGVSTASEILAAHELGLEWVKAFPGSLLGSAWISAMLGPFPGIKFAVTGGMTAFVAPDFLTAGARVVALSAAFTDPDQMNVILEVLGQAGR